MPRTYKTSSTKQYKKYDELIINAALKEYEKTNCSLADISVKYNISKSVLHRHNTRFMKRPGGQTALTAEAERYIIEHLNTCSEWGYPLDTFDLRVLVKGYLDRAGLTVKKFKENLPGPDFVKNFLKRNRDKISLRISQNIKRSRASVSPEVVEEYFAELEKTLEGVPLSNIINYDETNLSDDPGRRKVITKRGAKYPERVMNHSKGATSLMMAGTADGTLLPCFVVYKAKNLYDAWIQNGPKGCKYHCTSSGWFDGQTFENWVRTTALPYFKGKEGKKVLIGDNLSSHLSIDLIRECKEQNVHFVFLPANSTHITQPLDVAFFRPTKGAWRDILFLWKKTDGRNLPTVPKSVFPSLLKKLLDRIECQTKSNLLAGFLKAGISPLNKNKVLERLPKLPSDIPFDKDAVDQTVLGILKEMRYGNGTNKISNKRKKINVKPGQSVCAESETDSNESDSNDKELQEQELPEITVPGSNTETGLDLDERQEKRKIQPTLPKNIKPRHTIAKQIPEERKRMFEAQYAMRMKTPEPEKSVTKSIKPSIKIPKTNAKMRKVGTKLLKEPGQINTNEVSKPIQQPTTNTQNHNNNKINNEYENKNEVIFKKPCDIREYKKNKTINTRNDAEQEFFLKNTSDYQFPNNINALEVRKMPIYFQDAFDIQEEIEIKSSIEQESTETAEKGRSHIILKDKLPESKSTFRDSGLSKTLSESSKSPIAKKRKAGTQNDLHKEMKTRKLDNEDNQPKQQTDIKNRNQNKKNTKCKNKNENILKKACDLREYEKNHTNEATTRKKPESEIRLETDDAGNEFFFNNIGDYQLPDIDELDVEKMPIFLQDDFDILEDTEINKNLEQENTKKEKNHGKEKIDVVDANIRNTTGNIKIACVENFKNNKVTVDFKQNKKIALNDPVILSSKRKNKKYYAKDEDILCDLMDDDCE